MKPNSDSNGKIILSNLPDIKRNQIRSLLLDGTRDNHEYTQSLIHTYADIAYQCDVSIAAVRAVARQIKAELAERDLASEGELKSLAMTGSRMAMAQIIEGLQEKRANISQLPYIAGVLTDKYLAIKASDKAQTGLTVNVDLGEIAGSLSSILQRATDRQQAIDIEPVDTAP